MAVSVALALGSNLGDRIAHLRRAVTRLAESGIELRGVSSVYESPPEGYVAQPDFLNAALVGRTRLSPGELLAVARRLEAEAGRERSFPNAPRPLDVDIVLYGDRVVTEAELRIPHERWRTRAFVLAPLREIAGDRRDPETGRTVESFWDDLDAVRRDEVRRVRPASALSNVP